MITQQEAERIAAARHGPPVAGEGQGWSLMEFDHGWVLVKPPPPGDEQRVGGATEVIERESGRVVRFGSSTGLQRIMQSYPEVRDRGHEVTTAG